MPLTRATVTAASRVMLPAYVALTAVIGAVYTFDPTRRLNGVHALAVPRAVMGGTMTLWGVMFLSIASLMAVAFLTHRRALFVTGLYLCAATFLFWAGMYTVSVFVDQETSILAPVYPLFVVVACHASATSLLRGEHS